MALTLFYTGLLIFTKVFSVSSDVLLFSMGTQATNSTVIRTDEGLVVIDTNESPAAAEEILKYTKRKWINKSVKYVINTHHHFDHVQGNQVFPKAKIVAHKNCPQQMIAAADPKNKVIYTEPKNSSSIPPPPPAKTLYTDTPGYKLTLPNIFVEDEYNFNLGEKSFTIYYFGASHTDNDLLIVIPDEGLLFVGDLFYKKLLPHFSESYKPDVNRWKSIVSKIVERFPNLHTVISGHGEPFTLELFRKQFEYLSSLFGETKNMKELGFTDKEILDSLSLERRFGDLQHLDVKSSSGGSLHKGNIKSVLELIK